jgi:hypothetical protein
MNNETKKVTREELYEAIWKTPMTKLATIHGISPVALVKICEALKVPRPGPGHWQLVRRGWKIERPPLPLAEMDTPSKAALCTKARAPRAGVPATAADNINKTEAPGIPVPEDLRSAHPLIRDLKRVMDKAHVGSDGLLNVAFAEQPLRLIVSRAQAHRAMRILDALVSTLKRQGCRFEKAKDSDQKLLMVGEDAVSFGLTEELDRQIDEKRSEWRKSNGYSRWQEWRYSPSGKLKFSIYEYQPSGGRKSWTDCSRHRLENKLGEIVEWLLKT